MLDEGIELMIKTSMRLCCPVSEKLDKQLLLRVITRLWDQSESSLVMAARLRLLSFWVLLLLVAALCPAAHGKRGASFKGRGKSDSDKASPSQGRGLSKQGLKWAGAAAAGMLGGTGLGFLGKPKHGTGNHYKPVASEQQQPYYQENLRHHNQSVWKAFVRGAAPANRNIFPTLGHVVPFLTWIINK